MAKATHSGGRGEKVSNSQTKTFKKSKSSKSRLVKHLKQSTDKNTIVKKKTHRPSLTLTDDSSEKKQSTSQERKSRKFEKRMQRNPAAEFVKQCNVLFSCLINSKGVPKEEQQAKVERCLDFIHTYDVATAEAFSGKARLVSVNRCLQMCYKYGSHAQRDFITNLLKSSFARLACTETGSFLCIKMLKYSSIEKKKELAQLLVNSTVSTIAFTKYGSKVLDALFQLPKPFPAELFLKTTLFHLAIPHTLNTKMSDIHTNQTVATIYSKANDHGRRQIKEHLDSVVARCIDKELVARVFFHFIFEIYSELCTLEELKMLASNLAPCLTLLMATQQGCVTLCRLIDVINAKERKKFIQCWKKNGLAPYSVCMNSVSCIVLLKLLHVVDDTKLLKESLLSPLLDDKTEMHQEKTSQQSSLEALCSSYNGRKVFLTILTDQTQHYLSVPERSILNSPHQQSKKDSATRRSELLPPIHRALHERFQSITCQHLVEWWMKDKLSRDVLVEYMKQCKDVVVVEKICDAITQPWSWEHLWDHPTAQRTLAQLLRIGCSTVFETQQKTVVPDSTDPSLLLSTSKHPLVLHLWEAFQCPPTLNKVLESRGVFILIDTLKILSCLALRDPNELTRFFTQCLQLTAQKNLLDHKDRLRYPIGQRQNRLAENPIPPFSMESKCRISFHWNDAFSLLAYSHLSPSFNTLLYAVKS